MRGLLQNNLAKYAQAAVSAGAAYNVQGLQKVLEIQRDWILNKGAGFSESFDYSFGMSSPHCPRIEIELTSRKHPRLRLMVPSTLRPRISQDQGQPSLRLQLQH